MPARTGSTVRDSRQRTLRLGRLIKSGGAGSVFLLDGMPDEVVKLYHPGSDFAVYERKLEAMLALCPDLPDRLEHGNRYVQIAWPRALVHDARGRFAGFAMPTLDIAATSDLEHVLQERQARAAGLPTGLGAKMTLAANLATLLAALHRRGHYVVDLKPLNVRFYRESLYIAMLDCDGFSVQGEGERFPAGQVTVDYLAPEFQQRGVRPGQEAAQDRFALAVVLFQLLNSGIHPYSGRTRGEAAPTDLPGRIRAQMYAYGLRPHRDIAPAPVSGHAAMPEQLRRMFDRAFSTRPQDRPDAAQWASALVGYARREGGLLVACQADAQHQHFVGLPCAACARAEALSKAGQASATRQRSAQRRARRQNAGKRAAARQHAPAGTRAPAQQPLGQRLAQTQAQTLATAPTGLGMRLFMALLGPVLLGWLLGWGMPAYRAFDAASRSGGWWALWGDALALAFQAGVLLLGLLVFVALVPMVIMSRRP
ncbi:hypothetical protein LDO26_07945 [Luteimonas sp. BDR2-5]|uniref:hypothetical protein n=1 Tax=Proluteimonas luteida TaxID=2878685 RepID=UPI001E343104|nr:hypothetical protein [Luteimonas sp. BDR2-5]MCD9028140.1 hypothetical protein [Luteimonas sp. BDR2-5]